jgi:hypothetical protein
MSKFYGRFLQAVYRRRFHYENTRVVAPLRTVHFMVLRVREPVAGPVLATNRPFLWLESARIFTKRKSISFASILLMSGIFRWMSQ